VHKKRLIVTSVISLFLVSVLMLGSTYSVFVSSEIDENTNIYETGNLDISYAVDDENVILSLEKPLSNEDANQIYPYRITVTNHGNVSYMFDLILEDTTAGDVMDYKYVMTRVGELEPKTLSSCSRNKIKEGIILAAGESVSIDVRVWISEELPNTELGKSFFATFRIDGEALKEENEEIDNSMLSLSYMKSFSDENDMSYFHDINYINKIKNVSFVDYIDISEAVVSWDMSTGEDGRVMAWLVNHELEGYYNLYVGSASMIYIKNLDYFFSNMRTIDSISFENLNTIFTKSMKKMFYQTGYDSEVFSLDLGKKFDTSRVVDMNGMFMETGYSNSNFKLELGDNFNTSNVLNMDNMFMNVGYKNLELELDLSIFEVENVSSYVSMFDGFSENRKIYVKDKELQDFILNGNFKNLSIDNVLIAS